MARLNANFDGDENYLGPLVSQHAIPRSHSKNRKRTLEGHRQSQVTTNGQKARHASTKEGLQIPPLEPSKLTLRRQRPLRPLYMNLLPLPTQTDAVQSVHGESDLYRLRRANLTPRMNVKPPVHPTYSFSELLHKDSTFFESRQATMDRLGYVVIDSTSETDDDAQDELFQRTHREAYQPRVQTLPKLQLHGTNSNSTGKSAENIPSVIANTAPYGKPVLETLVADYSSSKANTSPESRPPENIVFFRYTSSTSESQPKYEGASSPAMSQIIPPTSQPASISKPQSAPKSCSNPLSRGFQSQEVSNRFEPESPSRKAQTLIRAKGLAYHSEQIQPTKPSPPTMLQDSLSKGLVPMGSEKNQQKHAFDKKKYSLAFLFLNDIDLKINNGMLEALAASTGGIKLIWSKKLTSTAGRANWRRENVRSPSLSEDILTAYRHHASIELAEKIIDCEDRLFNVIAHEYCHLANFMISGVKNKPHGKEFKEWARKVTLAFSHLSVKVTTTHNYKISYKYIWACASPSCGLEYKRHSRSIDPTRQSCGKCSGSLIQIKPSSLIGRGERARRGGSGEGEGEVRQTRGRYQDFVKRNFATVRSEHPGLGMAGWMVELGRRFRENNAQASGLREISTHGQKFTHATEDVNESMVTERPVEAEETNSVMIRLDLLSIK